jgi:hypothetical protein
MHLLPRELQRRLVKIRARLALERLMPDISRDADDLHPLVLLTCANSEHHALADRVLGLAKAAPRVFR